MDDRREQDVLLAEFRRERSIRRTVKVLESKRKHIREELQQLIMHIALLVPMTGVSQTPTDFHLDLLKEAVERLGDDAFTQLLMQLLESL